MTELEILKRAKMYIDKMANGKNPITDMDASEDDVINNIRVSRCLFYVSGVLDKVIANGGEIGARFAKEKKDPFHISAEELSKFTYSQQPLALSEIAKKISSLVDAPNMRKLKYDDLARLLVSEGFLEEYLTRDGRNRKKPTQKGLDSGISYDHRVGVDGNSYDTIVYDINAQRKVIELFSRTL